MYALLDMDDMVVRHKHPDHSTLSSLGKIEVAHSKVKVIPLTPAGVSQLTDMEVRLLLSHVTRTAVPKGLLHTLTRELLTALQALPDSDVNAFEVKHQAAQIPLRDSGFYRYVKGAYTAKRLEELFVPAAIDVTTPAHVAAVVPSPAPVPQQAPKTVPQQLQLPAVLPSWHPAHKSA